MRATGRSDLVDLEVYVHAETEKALFVSGVGPGSDKRVWLPKSQIEINDRSQFLAEITVPEWLAIDKELV